MKGVVLFHEGADEEANGAPSWLGEVLTEEGMEALLLFELVDLREGVGGEEMIEEERLTESRARVKGVGEVEVVEGSGGGEGVIRRVELESGGVDGVGWEGRGRGWDR